MYTYIFPGMYCAKGFTSIATPVSPLDRLSKYRIPRMQTRRLLPLMIQYLPSRETVKAPSTCKTRLMLGLLAPSLRRYPVPALLACPLLFYAKEKYAYMLDQLYYIEQQQLLGFLQNYCSKTKTAPVLLIHTPIRCLRCNAIHSMSARLLSTCFNVDPISIANLSLQHRQQALVPGRCTKRFFEHELHT